MSIEYTVYANDDPNDKVLWTGSLSNTSHADWQEKTGISRSMKNTETGEIEEWLFNTTVWDKERLYLSDDDVWQFVHTIAEGDENYLPILETLLEVAEANNCERIYV